MVWIGGSLWDNRGKMEGMEKNETRMLFCCDEADEAR